MPDIGYFGESGDGGYQPPDVINDPGMTIPKPTVGAGGQGITDPRAPVPSSGYPSQGGTASPYDAVAEFYRTALGREGGSNEINSWLSGTGGNLSAIQQGIYGSDEAKAYGASRSAGAGATTAPAGNYSDADILAQIGRWAAMPGADPSLAKDPNYWLGAIKGKGGLNAGNLQFWQDASVGPTAFINNPNREQGGAAGAGGSNPGGYTDPSSMLYLSQVMQRLNQVQQPQDNSIFDLLKSLATNQATKLQGAPYSAADEQALITQYREPLTQARDTAKQQAAIDLSRRGFTPTSGVFQDRMKQIDKSYEQGIATGANTMGVNAVAQKNANVMQALNILSSLSSANNTQIDRSNAMSDQAVNLAKMFPDFDAARLDQLLRAGSDTGGSSAISSLTGLGNLNLNAIGMNNQNDAANSAAWGKLIAGLIAQAGG